MPIPFWLAKSKNLFTVLVLTCTALFSASTQAQIQAQEPTQRMMVVLAPEAVAAQRVGGNDRLENIFPDQRVQQSPRAWSAVSLQTALLVRDIENRIGSKALVTFGNLTHGFGAELSDTQIAALRADSRVQDVFNDPLGEPLLTHPTGSTFRALALAIPTPTAITSMRSMLSPVLRGGALLLRRPAIAPRAAIPLKLMSLTLAFNPTLI